MSKKSGSVFVSAAGLIGGFVDKLISKFQALGGTDEQLHELLVGKGSDEFVARVAKMALEMASAVRDGFRIVVDYTKSLAEMISAGNYDWVNFDITSKHFSITGQGRVELNAELVHYGKFTTSDDIIQDMDKRGFRPGTLAELLAFGKEYSEKQREFPIVALDSVWRHWHGRRYVACLDCGGAPGAGWACLSGGTSGVATTVFSLFASNDS